MAEDSYIARRRMGDSSLWKGRIPPLLKLDVELTERCNNNCVHCYINLPAGDAEVKKRELSTEEVEKYLTEAASLGCLKVRFTGGEPLLRRDFEELYIFARRLGLKVTIFTNATLLTPHLVKLFSRIPPLELIEVTLYGMSAESYDSISRISGSYEAAWRGINLLLDERVPFVVKGVRLPANRGEFEGFEKWAATIPWMDKSPTIAGMLYLRCRRDSEGRNRIIRSLRLKPEEILSTLIEEPESYIGFMQQFFSKFIDIQGSKLFYCGAAVGSLCIDSYGHLQTCMTCRHPDTIYDLKSGSIRDALTSFFPKVREMEASNPEYLRRCARCFLNGLCDQCPGWSWMEHGTLDTPVEYVCEIAHLKARYLGLLGDDEMAWEVNDWRERIDAFIERDVSYLVENLTNK